MVFKSKIKWVALFVLTLSLGSLVAHLSMTKFSSMNLVQYSAKDALSHDFPNIGSPVGRNKRLWGSVRSLESLQPYANPRNSYPVPNDNNNGFIYAKIFGGFEKIRSSICDLVTISRLLNATLVIPEIQESTRSKGISYKFKSFSYLYDEEQFIASLKNDVIIVKSLPEYLKAARRKNEFPTFKPKNSASPSFYVKEILPSLKKAKVVGLIITDGGCLQSILPPSMSEFQRLRCRVAFHALQFRPEIQILGRQMVERLQAWGQPFLAYHPGLVRDTLAYHGCAELFQDVHTELIQYRRDQMIKQGIINEELSVDSHLRRENGSCPLMPEEVGLLLRAMGYPSKTIIYLAGSETFGGQRLLIPLRAMFANLVDLTSLCSKTELLELIGPEAPLPPDTFQIPHPKSEEQLKEEWNKAGPRPRPLPPPPDRPIYQHEKEGWYGWITESDKEPGPSPMDLRMKAHRLLWDALDYIVSVEADAFFPGFNNDGSGWPDFSGLVIGQRLYERASSRSYRPDRKIIAALFKSTRDDMYHPKRNWTLSAKEHLNRSLSEDGLIRQSLLAKPTSFLSHPLPECSCRISSVEITKQTKDKDGGFLYGGEEECPKWMQSAGAEGVKYDDTESAEDDNDVVEQLESDGADVTSSLTSQIDNDEEWDPDD
ncbi:O-fucosyltransferase family protein isoform 1 [Theobroma cacao]|uniref:O-fucosyltransferase family protein n=1 Tax=Theobroma cacao TaxID=3641 RepID=A0A061F1K7_THECC|nr:O-fucosyltransferase family protein isoform 1 [Theobroma cacao]EOY10567.1 O-fucosyltransferase family protein isoform 1 [Theobroma cacao]